MHTLRTLVAIVALAFPITSFAAAGPAARLGGPRVRPYDGRAAAIMLGGIERSETFRSLVNRIEAGDVIVYLQMQHSLRKEKLAGAVTWLAVTPQFRYVRVSLNPELTIDAAISALGHELWHVLEIADEKSVVSEGSLAAFYARHGIVMRAHNGFDTLAARDAGDEVRKDLTDQAKVVRMAVLDLSRLDWAAVYQDARGRTR
jgi:hypothetical protein